MPLDRDSPGPGSAERPAPERSRVDGGVMIDYPRLLRGLNGTADRVRSHNVGLPAVTELVTALAEAAGGAGATFTEFMSAGGRVVAASDGVSWALGQPVEADQYVRKDAPRAWAGLIEELPGPIAEPLLARGLIWLAGHAVIVRCEVVGAIHLYFTRTGDPTEVLAAVQTVANAVAYLYATGSGVPSTSARRDEDWNLFLEVTGHELRTPVTVIKGYANTLVDRWEELDEVSRRKAARVLAQRADELARLIDRLLAASGGEPAAAWPSRLVPFDLLEAVLRATNELPTELRRAIRVSLPNGLPLVQGDPASLVPILSELVTNAIRHGSPPDALTGPPTVELQAFADQRTVLLRVADRGVGIDPADTERAFNRFWQGGRDKGNRNGGVGLGLYLVRRLVERQNGWVSLRPRDGGGTVVEVRLPRADGARSPDGMPAGDGPVPAAVPGEA